VRSIWVVCLALWFCLAETGAGAESTNALSKLAGGHRVVFLGDSITYSGQYIEFVEAYYASRFPTQHIEFVNLGLPSETVSGLSEDGHAGGKFPRPELRERLDRVLARTRPDLVIACYGMNDGIYLPFSQERFQKFKDGILQLREKTKSAGAKIIHLTPPVFDEVKGGHPGYAEALDRYSNWLLEQRKAGWDVADIHFPMKRYLTERRAREPNFYLANDGVHIGETGHWLIAQQLLLYLGANEINEFPDASAMLAKHPRGADVLKLVQDKQRLLKDAWLTDTGHKRLGMKQGPPLPEAQTKAAELDRQLQAAKVLQSK
jgi:lysophospholipase L1-like esterase